MADDLHTSEVQGLCQNETTAHADAILVPGIDDHHDQDLENSSAAVATEEPDNSSDAPADILQQALVEASGGNISHIEEDESELVYAADTQPEPDTEKEINPTTSLTENAKSTITGEATETANNTIPGQANLNDVNTTASALPLGSKSNPIRIIQQGNTYTSTQQLSQEQIQQIVQVLQRQNIAARSVDGSATAVFNPETNTRIVYRVVQPHSRGTASGASTNADTKLSDGTRPFTARDYHQARRGSKGRPRFVCYQYDYK